LPDRAENLDFSEKVTMFAERISVVIIAEILSATA
jgi:hypothetical protein